jgi:hypothetical protein
MYDLFLGLRAATQPTDGGCAMAVLDATRAAATDRNRAGKVAASDRKRR